MKITEENSHRLTILIFIIIFTTLTHVIFALGDFVPPPYPNIYAVSTAWFFSGIGTIWSAIHLASCRGKRGEQQE